MSARTCTGCGTFMHASYFASACGRRCKVCDEDRRKRAIQKQQRAIAAERRRVGYVERPVDPLNVVAAEWLRSDRIEQGVMRG